MVSQNRLKLDCIVTVSQRFLFKNVEVNSLDEIYSKDFFVSENLEKLKQNSVTLPTEVVINCVELNIPKLNFIAVKEKWLNLFSCKEFYFDIDLGSLTFKNEDDLIFTLESNEVLFLLKKEKLNFLPCGILENIHNFFNL